MIGWILKVVTWLLYSSEVRAVIRTMGDVMNVLPDGFVARAFAVVKETAAAEDMTNAQKFSAVYQTLATEYPDVKANTMRVVIESIVAAVKKGLG